MGTHCISGKVSNVEMFANFANPKNSETFPMVCFIMSDKTQCNLSTDFGEL